MGDYLLVTDNKRTTTLDGIELPDNVRQQEMCFGFVVAVGPLCGTLKQQDRICYGPYAGKTVALDGFEFRLLREGQVEGRLITADE
jgi:co-chaperonin GroES (HSP10)